MLTSLFFSIPEFALFDKSNAVVSCKRTNRVVNDYLGATGKGPLVGADKRLLRSYIVEMVNPDSLDDYFAASESFSQAISRATSLSFLSGAQIRRMTTFLEGDESEDNTNLEEARFAIQEANEYLKKAISFLGS